MNLVESMKFVLKKKRQHIFSGLIKEDLKKIVKDVAVDVVDLTKRRSKSLKLFSLKDSFQDAKNSLHGTALLIKVLPHRINEAFAMFITEMMIEMEKLPDQKERTKFCMKLLAALSKETLSGVYGGGKNGHRLLTLGRGKAALPQVITARLLFGSIQAFIIRFIEEIEKEMTDPQELENLRSFKEIVLDDKGNAVDKFFEGVMDLDEPAFRLVEEFKHYVFTGEKLLKQN